MELRGADLEVKEGGLRLRGFTKENSEKLPLISVITIVYNAASVLESTIKSVLFQDYSNVEYIIIDGESIDGTSYVIKKYDKCVDYWISEKDKGIYDAMNKGAEFARGQWIIYMNAGDSFYNCDTLKKFVASISENENAEIIYGDTYLHSEFGEKAFKMSDHRLLRILNSHNTICHQSAFVRREVVQNLMFRDFKYSMDLEFWTRCLQNGLKFKHISEIVSNYYVGGISSSPNTALSVLIEHRIVKMLWLRNYSTKALISLVFDYYKLYSKLFLRSFLGNKKYYKLKKSLKALNKRNVIVILVVLSILLF